MTWVVEFHPDFDPEFEALAPDVQDALVERLQAIAEFGPNLGRPIVDTLYDSSFPNMKEVRFQCDGVWRFAFAFDPAQQAVVLVGGDKEGEQQKAFYKRLIKVADKRFVEHIAALKALRRK